ncbi:MAG: AraC family transcriptional regulator, partial [Nannocystaceae bacterium]|nr:AraC family transcriptional regulator [Nannocystaceae bacterium]
MSNTTNEGPDPQGTQTSAVLRNLIAAGLAKRLPQAVAADADKTTMLRALEASLGPAAVVDLGLDLRAWPDNPVFAAVTAASSAVGVLQRWFRLERFGHTRNRTRLLDHDGHCMTICHVAIDGGSISAVNDLFVWGIILAVLERAGFRDIEASLIAPDGVRTPL